jgi:thioredoxin 1
MKKIVRFTASWCGPCKTLAKTLEEVDSKLPIEVVDVDIHPEIAAEFGIRGVPTLVIVEDNIPSKRLVGNKTKQELEAFIND